MYCLCHHASSTPQFPQWQHIHHLALSFRTKTPSNINKTQLDNLHKSPWVWQHFITQGDVVSKLKKNTCQFSHPSGGGKSCGLALTVDSSGSTRSMAQHLNLSHNIHEETVVDIWSMTKFMSKGNLKIIPSSPNISLNKHVCPFPKSSVDIFLINISLDSLNLYGNPSAGLTTEQVDLWASSLLSQT